MENPLSSSSDQMITQIPASVNPPTEPPKKWIKIWILIILILTIVGWWAWYYFSSDKTETSDIIFESAPEIAVSDTGSLITYTGTTTSTGEEIESTGSIWNPEIQKVYKIQTYSENADGTYTLYSYGSAIYVGENRILTNAHVIMGSDDLPTGKYNLCMTYIDQEKPICSLSLKLIRYNTTKDIALLEPIWSAKLWIPTELNDRKLSLWETIKVLGYPSSWGKTLSFTEGKMSGTEKWYYKIDANIDHGNSWWWAFDSDDIFVGMPYIAQTGLTTMGYIIPVSMILEFLAGKWDITEYSEDQMDFSNYIMGINTVMSGNTIENPFFRFSWFLDAWLRLESTVIDKDGYGTYMFVSDSESTVLTIAIPRVQWSEYFSSESKKNEIEDYFEDISVETDIEKNSRMIEEYVSVSGMKKTNGTIDENYSLTSYRYQWILYMFMTEAKKSESDIYTSLDSLFWNNLVIKKKNSSIPDWKIRIHKWNFEIPKWSYTIKSCGEKCKYDISISPTIESKYYPLTLNRDTIKKMTFEEFTEKTKIYYEQILTTAPESIFEVKINSQNESYIYTEYENSEWDTILEALFFGRDSEYKYVQHNFSIVLPAGESDWKDVFKMMIDTVNIEGGSPFLEEESRSSEENEISWISVQEDDKEIPYTSYEGETEETPSQDENMHSDWSDVREDDTLTPIPSSTPTATPKTKSIDYCEVKFDWVTYRLDPCSIDETMSLSEWDKSFEYKIIPSNTNSSYAFSVYWYGEWFPTYGILWSTSGWAQGTIFQNPYFNSQYLKVGKYSWYLQITIQWSNGASSREMRLYIDLNVEE